MSTAAPDVPAVERLKKRWETPSTLYGWISTVDHKMIGKRYLVTAFIFLLVGGIEALLIRTQLAGPEQRLLTPEAYDQIFSMHGITMIFWYASPILAGFGNYLVPLMIGARDMAFPRLNAFTYWTFLLSGVLLYVSVPLGIAPHDGWFSYVPYAGRRFSPDLNMDFYALSLIFLTISTTAGAINFIATIFRLRAPGMSINRMPLFMYSTLTTLFSTDGRRPVSQARCCSGRPPHAAGLRIPRPPEDADAGEQCLRLDLLHHHQLPRRAPADGHEYAAVRAALARRYPAQRPPYHAMHNASLYWHFVDLVWLFILSLLYVVPNLRR